MSFSQYRYPSTDNIRSLTDLINSEYIAICSCGMNHTFCLPEKRAVLDYSKERSPFRCGTENSWVGTVSDLQSLMLYRYPYTNDVRSIHLLRDTSCISICSCGMNHSYSAREINEVLVEGAVFACKTPISWAGNVGDLKKRINGLMNFPKTTKTTDNSENHQKEEFAIKNSEISLLLAIRKEYEKPPDKNIIAALLIPMWLRKQKMPTCDTGSLIELYDLPVK